MLKGMLDYILGPNRQSQEPFEHNPDVDQPAFKEGFNAPKGAENPYPLYSEERRLWDAGSLDAWSVDQW